MVALQDLDFGTADYDGRTALHLAAAEGRVEVVRWLLLQPSAIQAVNATDCMRHTPFDAAEQSMNCKENQKHDLGTSTHHHASSEVPVLPVLRLIRRVGGRRHRELTALRAGANADRVERPHLGHAGTL